tara:strand:+ start:236 stop:1858 length:1623 start_codon:yes stop_codon:yes gene_type:complete
MRKTNSPISMQSNRVAPVVLAILDGWGHREESQNNAVKQANTPIFDALWESYPHTLIEASGGHVGLPDNQMGNSEVGHLTIGAGRIFQQELVRISNTVNLGLLNQISALDEIGNKLIENGGTLHIIGLCSDGGVHSHINHLCGVIDWAASKGLKKVALHGITDGRDTPAKSAHRFITKINDSLQANGIGELASLCGRYWAMDRDNRWERTSKAFELIANPDFPVSSLSPFDLLQKSYENNITDEFLEPVRLTNNYLKDGDGLIMFNFRPDRARQLIKAITLSDFDGFEKKWNPILNAVTFTQYEANLPVSIAFPPESLNDLLGQVVAENGLRQYRTAETEKYPHVTYFMNGGIEKPLKGEDRFLVPSPRVATYDLQPEMSADELTRTCKEAIEKGVYSLVIINYANPDMVGHTGRLDAAMAAVSKVDTCLGELLDSIGKMGGTLLVTADHGNAELMQGPDGEPWTAHTTNPVPVILIEGEKRKLEGLGNDIILREGGGLSDLAPTLLHILDLQKPEAMSGCSLIKSAERPALHPRIPQHV